MRSVCLLLVVKYDLHRHRTYTLHPTPVLSQVGGVLWFSMHAAHTSLYTPFPVGLTTDKTARLPDGFTQNSLAKTDRGLGAWQSAHFVYSAAQLYFGKAIATIQAAQALWEGRAESLIRESDASYLNGSATIGDISQRCSKHATAAVVAWWELSDDLLRGFTFPSDTYPDWWLQATDYADGPEPSPVVPPPPTHWGGPKSESLR
jgi:hypothetical protein